MLRFSWTAEEDDIVLNSGSHQAACLRLRGKRTAQAIKQRRNRLRHPPLQRTFGLRWTKEEMTILRRKYEFAGDTRELTHLFPRFTAEQIREKAHHMGLKRLFTGSGDVRVKGHKELIDQIRIRSKQDGIALYKLDKVLKTGTYFGARSHWTEVSKINLSYVARAVEFFGGTLVIDWCDR